MRWWWVHYVQGDRPGSFHYDYSGQCPNDATGHGTNGFPRCDDHRARRYLVTVGTSLALTEHAHDTAASAREEILQRLPADQKRSPNVNRVRARPATSNDIETYELLARQTLASVLVAGPPHVEDDPNPRHRR